MIGKLIGIFGGTTPDGSALIEVGGVGYAVHVPLFTITTLRAERGPISLFIHTAVREDAIDLYGFITEEELVFFKQLMSVSGIGPKSALGILNVANVGNLKRSIAKGDASALTKVFGIGKKSAERIVVELRDKVSLESESPAAPGSDGEVIDALLSLGYRAEESRNALKQVSRANITGVNDRITAALKYLGSRQ
jgi:Holliday junction DNA helicase RuvA